LELALFLGANFLDFQLFKKNFPEKEQVWESNPNFASNFGDAKTYFGLFAQYLLDYCGR
jgi:hypothetical protein